MVQCIDPFIIIPLGHYEVMRLRRAMDIEIALTPRADGMPLQRWLYAEIRAAILSGRLMPGSRLPATRDLALRLKISRGTVLAVYEQLGAEGYIRSLTGRGSDDADRVIYCGTFSKLLFPSLRMAYAVLPDQLIVPFTAALSLTYRHLPLIVQTTLHEFISEGHFGRHVRRMRLLYAERAQALRQAADAHLAGLLEIPKITMGLDTPAFLPSESDDKYIAQLAAQAGIESRPLSVYAGAHTAPPGLLLGFAAVSPTEINAGARILARVLEAVI